MMCDCDIKISTKPCQMQCPKLTQSIQISIDDFSNLFFSKLLKDYCMFCVYKRNTFYVICKLNCMCSHWLPLYCYLLNECSNLALCGTEQSRECGGCCCKERLAAQQLRGTIRDGLTRKASLRCATTFQGQERVLTQVLTWLYKW